MKTTPFNLVNVKADCAVRVFCLPYAGGSTSIYREWPQYVPDWMQVCPVELPGRGALFATAPATALIDLVGELSDALRAYEGQPFALFGHSMGALIAYEVARKLELAGTRSLVRLFVSGTRPPFLPRNREPISHLPDFEFIEKLRKLNGTPKEILDHEELMEFLLPMIRNDFRIVEKYGFDQGNLLNTPTVVFAGTEDDEVSIEDAQQWSKLTKSPIKLVKFPGDHFFIYPQTRNIIKEITNFLSTPFMVHRQPTGTRTAEISLIQDE
jgi:medium-chain acyl-[acyl-carrier-protein] hydrolase